MAFHVYAELTINGTELTGETTLATIGDVDVSSGHIEIYELNFGAERALREGSRSGRSIGRHQLMPLRLVKRTDRSTPLLYEALSRGRRIDGEIKLFDAHPETGEIHQHFAITLAQARLTAMTTTSPDVFDPEDSNRPVYDFLELLPNTITYTDVLHGIEFMDSQARSLRKKAGSSKAKSKKSSGKSKKDKKRK
jgi:type VI secretion system Hcp family effector